LLDNYILNIVGSQLSHDEKNILAEKLKDRYVVSKHITNLELNEIYNRVQFLIYPSEYEGFGIPILEAMAAGCPVIPMKVSSILEVSGDATIYVNENPSEISNAILRLGSSTKFRNEIISIELDNIKRFSWDKCYLETKNLYKELYYFEKYDGWVQAT
jgi:mannosyltransferase